MKLPLLALIFSFSTIVVFSQKATITGYVEDKSTGEKLIGASVYDSKNFIGTSSNVYGFFSLSLDTGIVDFSISYIGYITHKQTINLKENIFLNISLEAENILEEIVVSAESVERIHEESQMSNIKIPMKNIEKLPAFMGEKDLMKTVQLLPGVQSGSEGSSGLYVRGGGPDQNLILLDGVPVYNASHLFGFFSVFNSNAIKNVEIIKGGFPARYGGRVSSVLDIRMKEGNQKEFAGEASVGIISSKLTIEGPIIKDKTSFILSGRRTYIDVLTRPLIRSFGDVDGGYYFYDLNAKINHKFSDKCRLYLSTYMGKDRAFSRFKDTYSDGNDRFSSQFDSGLEWGNITTALRYNHIITKNLFANATVTYSRYKFDIGFEVENSSKSVDSPENYFLEFNYISGIHDWAGKLDFDYLPAPNHYIRFGIGNTYHTFTPGVNAVKYDSNESRIDTTFGSNNIYANELSAYFEDDIKLGELLKVNAGLHFSTFNVKSKTYINFQPRISINYIIAQNLSAKVSYSQMTQYLHLLTNGSIGLPTDLWVPVTDSVPPVLAEQLAAGFAYTLSDKYEFSIEGYYKKMDNLIEYKDGASFMGNSENWDKKIEVGEGNSYGLEFFVQKKTGKFSGWIGYTLAWSNRHFDNLNFGRTFAYKYDRRHDVSIALVYEPTKTIGYRQWDLDLGLVWVYGTGNSVSLPVSTYRALDLTNNPESDVYYVYTTEIDNFTDRNNYREPAYHRLDLSATISRTKGNIVRSWSFSVYNVYNRQNPFFLRLDRKDNGERVLKQYSIFPIIPSISFAIKF